MTLTPEQRYTAYCIMLAEAEERQSEYTRWGFYYMIDRLIGIYESDLPELRQAIDKWIIPAETTYAWRERARLLRQIIAELEKELYT